MRMMTKAMVALGFIGAMALGAPTPSLAQGVYFSGPGIGFSVGRPWYGHRYYRHHYYGGPYAYYGPRPYRHYRHWRRWDW